MSKYYNEKQPEKPTKVVFSLKIIHSDLFVLNVFQGKIQKIIEHTSLRNVIVTNLTNLMEFAARVSARWLKTIK